MSQDNRLFKLSEHFPVGATVMYCNSGGRGHGNSAKILGYLHRTGFPEQIAAIELEFRSGGLHLVRPNQLKKYYRIISNHGIKQTQ